MAKTKSKKMDKSKSQEIHAINRFKERYGIDLSHDQYKKLCSYIKKGFREYSDGTIVTYIDKQSCRLVVKKIIAKHICKDPIIAVYDKLRSTIVTVLDPSIDSADKIDWIKYV